MSITIPMSITHEQVWYLHFPMSITLEQVWYLQSKLWRLFEATCLTVKYDQIYHTLEIGVDASRPKTKFFMNMHIKANLL